MKELVHVVKPAAIKRLAENGVNTLPELWQAVSMGQLECYLSEADAKAIRASIELGKGLLKCQPFPLKFTSPASVGEYYLSRLADLEQEHVFALFLNQDCTIIREHLIGIGTCDTCLADPKDLFREALRAGARQIVLLHNHPHCEPTPSEPDVMLTRRLIECGRMLGIAVNDHIIIGGRGGWQSVAEWVAKQQQQQQTPGHPVGIPKSREQQVRELVEYMKEAMKEDMKRARG